MGRLLFVIFSLTVLVTSCSDEEKAEPKEEVVEEQESETTDETSFNIAGKWQIVRRGNTDVSNDEYFSRIRHQFMNDGTMFLYEEVEPTERTDSAVAQVEAGIWQYFPDDRTFRTIMLPDSIVTDAELVKLTENTMVIQVKEGPELEWKRIK